MPQENAPEFRLAVQRLARRIRGMRAEGEVTDSQLSVIFALYNDGPMTLGGLAEHEKVTPPSMNRTVGTLVESGYVSRSSTPEDARKVILDLTPAGRTFVDDTRRTRDTWITTRLAELSEKQQRILRAATPILKELADQ